MSGGLTGYYRKFKPNFNTPFVWTVAWQQAFQSLKDALISAPVLRPHELQTECAKSKRGAVISKRDTDMNEYVVTHASRGNNKAEGIYFSYEGEALAVVWADHR